MIGLSFLAFVRAGEYLESAALPPAQADIIICLGGDWGERSLKAAELYRKGLAKYVLVTGPLELLGVPGRTAPKSRPQYLIENGVPATALIYDPVSLSSRDEAEHALALMRTRGWHRALVVSDPPHMRRLSMIWNRTFAGSGKEFRVVASPMRNWDAGQWWRDAWSREFVIKEYLKLGRSLVFG